MTGFKAELTRLVEANGFTQATLEAGRLSDEKRKETDYRVMQNSLGELNVVPPRTGDNDIIAIDWDLLRSRRKGERMVYHGHFHPSQRIGIPSNIDLDLVDRYSGRDTPIFAVCVNGDEDYIDVNAFRRKMPAAYSERVFAIARQVANGFLYNMLGLDTQGFTGTKYRRYAAALRRGFIEANEGEKGYLDVVPDAIAETGAYEAAGFTIRKREFAEVG